MNFDLLWDVGRMAGAGLIAGLFATFIGTKEHRFKKWWEMRVTAYQTVIEALSDLAYAYDVRYQAEIEGRDLAKDREAELSALIHSSYTRVRKAADAGAFLFSKDANAALDLVRTEWGQDHQTYQDALDSMQFTARQCLERIVQLSMDDLQLRTHLMIWK